MEYSVLYIIGGGILLIAYSKEGGAKILTGTFFYSIGIVLFYLAEQYTRLSLDSFIEISHGSTADAKWILKNEWNFITQNIVPSKRVLVISFVLSVAAYVLIYFFQSINSINLRRPLTFVFLALSVIGILVPLREIYGSSRVFLRLKDNYSTIYPVSTQASVNVDVVLLIGESIGAQNMSAYGYFYNTTPFLRSIVKNDSWIKLDYFFSNHTHTTPSLLDMFSEPLECGKDKDVYKDKRSPILKSLHNAGVRYHYFTSQPIGGSANFAVDILFDTASVRRMVPSLSDQIEQSSTIYFSEKEFFQRALNAYKGLPDSGPRIKILHSYSGHFPYHFLPNENYTPIGSKNLDQATFEDKQKKSLSEIQRYNDAVKYFDGIAALAAEALNRNQKPSILIITSDHGESIYTNASHDSSRFQPEMIKIPFFIYFNDLAKDKFYSLYNKIKDGAAVPHSTSLIPELLREILGVSRPPCLLNSVSATKSYPVPQRDTDGRFRFSHPILALYNDSLENKSLNYCYHGAITEGSIARAKQFTNCIEFDVAITDLPKLRDLLEKYKAWGFEHLWLDFGHDKISAKSACEAVSQVRTEGQFLKSFIIELNEESLSNIIDDDCIDGELRELIYLQLGTDILRDCVKSEAFRAAACGSLERIINRYLENGYHNFTLDSIGLPFIKHMSKKNPSLKMAIWNYSKSDGLVPEAAKYIMYRFQDPNWPRDK
jgi:glucan phosphoethanolaminetransferase (alkaline phosphatase superfamily)